MTNNKKFFLVLLLLILFVIIFKFDLKNPTSEARSFLGLLQILQGEQKSTTSNTSTTTQAFPFADFVITTDKQDEFTFRLYETEKVDHARKLLAGENLPQQHIRGYVVTRRVEINPSWSFHINPDSVDFFEDAVEVCDATASYIESNLDKVGGSFLPGNIWCPWSSKFVREIFPQGVGRSNLAVFRPSDKTIYYDRNSNGKWEGSKIDGLLKLQIEGSKISLEIPPDRYRVVAGDWEGDGETETGVYLRVQSDKDRGLFILDLDNDGIFSESGGDKISGPFGGAGSIPLAGDLNGDGRDEIIVWYSKDRRFYIDSNNSLSWDVGDVVSGRWGISGDYPIVGDFNGDGKDDLGIWHMKGNNLGVFYLDSNNNYKWDGNKIDVLTSEFGARESEPVGGDWNGDGKDEIGVFFTKNYTRQFFLDYNGDLQWDKGDVVKTFGIKGDTPLILPDIFAPGS